jgi:hypothetical protein
MLGGVGVFALSAISLVIAAFNGLIVLPASLVTELVCQRLSIRGIVPRLASFLLSGLLLGIAIASIVMIVFGLYHSGTSVGSLLASGSVILVICDCVVFVFGLVLTMLSALKDRAICLKTKRKTTLDTDCR